MDKENLYRVRQGKYSLEIYVDNIGGQPWHVIAAILIAIHSKKTFLL